MFKNHKRQRLGYVNKLYTWGQVSCHWPDLEASFLLQVDVDVFQLRDVVLPGKKQSLVTY